MNEIMKMEHVSLAFSTVKALDDLNFTVQAGEIFGFLGPSGAGKTTTMKLLSGQLRQDEGIVHVFQKNVKNNDHDLYAQIGILSDNSGLYDNLSVYENLKLFADIRHLKKANIKEVLAKLKLEGQEKKLVKKLSRGMRQRLMFATVILHKPRLLFLDEPTSALDPATSEAVHKIILDLNKEGTTIFLTTHNMEEADKLCDRVAFLHQGHIMECGNPQELKVKYANNCICIQTNQGDMIQTTKDKKELISILSKMDNEILTIHSVEPDLKTIFLNITGREL